MLNADSVDSVPPVKSIAFVFVSLVFFVVYKKSSRSLRAWILSLVIHLSPAAAMATFAFRQKRFAASEQ
jgi:hypothetical protein